MVIEGVAYISIQRVHVSCAGKLTQVFNVGIVYSSLKKLYTYILESPRWRWLEISKGRYLGIQIGIR